MQLDVDQLVGPYRIVRRLGQGTMGVVYQAHDTLRQRDVALKMMVVSDLSDEAARSRFFREARAAAGLRHRNIVAVLDYAEEGHAPYIVMELLEGVSLAERLPSSPPLTLDAKLDIMIQLCEGLQFAHEQGVVHRDVKPANIWLLHDGSIKLLDFGIASVSGTTSVPPADVHGSAGYMAPEQISGKAVDGRADTFAAGVVMYELITGKRPFEADTITGVMLKILNEEPPDLRTLTPDVPDDVAAAIARALQKDPEQRYPHIADFSAALWLARTAARLQRAPIAAQAPVTPDAPDVPDAAVASDPVTTARLDRPTAPVESFDLPIRAPGAPVATPRRSVPVPDGRKRARLLVGLAVVALVVAAVAIGAIYLGVGAAYQVEVQSTPAGASIAIDGVDSGKKTPATIESAAKPERLHLSLAGFEAIDEPVTGLSDKKSVTLRYDLRRLVRVASTPGDAAIYVDGVDTGRRTPSEIPVPNASAKLELLLVGFVQSAPVTPEMLTSGDVQVKLTRVGAAADADPADLAGRVTLHLNAPYDVVVDGSCASDRAAVAAAVAAGRNFVVTPPCVLSVRAPKYLFSEQFRIDAKSPNREIQTPLLIPVDLRTKWEQCNVLLNGTSLGEPPVRQTVAEGAYDLVIQCGGIRMRGRAKLNLKTGKEDEKQNGYYVWYLDKRIVER